MNKQNLNIRKYCEILKALGHPSRVMIIQGLLKNECSVAQIQQRLGLPQSTISQHLRLLRNYGIIQSRQEGTRRCYRVVDNKVKEIVRVIEKR